MTLRSRLAVIFAVWLSVSSSTVFSDPPKADLPPIRSEDSMLAPESMLQWIWRQGKEAGFQFTFIPAIHKFVDKEYSKRVLDAHLFAYWGFHQMPEQRHYNMRTWRPVSPNGITREMVVGMTPEQFSTWIRMAMEIEEPIVGYSYQSGMGFRMLLPGLGRFMGRDPESRAYAESQGISYCDSAWCAEEDRHAKAFKRIIEALMGRKLVSTNPSDVETPNNTLEYALQHVDSRQSTEWNASSTYAALLIHCNGTLHDFFKNAFRDEVKHLSILSAVDRYLRGPQAWRRLKAIFAQMMRQVRYHTGAEGRSGGGNSFKDPVFLFELLYTHALVEIKMQQWLDSLPHTLLTKIFETESKLPDFVRGVIDPAVVAEHTRLKEESRRNRLALSLWPAKDRREMFELLAFMQKHEAFFRIFVRDHLGGFVGYENPLSEDSKRMRRRLMGFSAASFGGIFTVEEMPLVRRALYEYFRSYQIENNFETMTFDGRLEPDETWHNVKLFPRRASATVPSTLAQSCPGKIANARLEGSEPL